MQPTQNQFTEKAWEAIVRSQDGVKQAQQQQLESEHLLLALLEQEGLANSIFTKVGLNLRQLRDRTEAFINRQPKVSGSGASIYLGKSFDTLLDRADQRRQEYGDEYISIEHLLLAYGGDDRFGKALYQELGLTEATLKQAIQEIRGTQKVTDQNPEGKYQSPKK